MIYPFHLPSVKCYLFCRSVIQNIMKEGKLVPSDVTVKLLQRAMQETDSEKFLIDGFPRNMENVTTFENIVISFLPN